ncbi:hypothetical protein VHA01S_032_00100 [Vibrio halioticoli NBRC 102217]|uniref:Polysaccharide biosynthesis protein n=1 Tax=Vibrio halioticoli NBRC 102217 TaxID=1219072 RepID=V5HLJ0_9VIBR|nr:oligosaccharide flippase family protein [Vibrio halioticoli]GAD90060.1 hypothetical protein VHA01S_032_00100 [Vibrio halioticoli NBRC 102217]
MKNIIKNNAQALKNVSYLSVMQALLLAAPFVTYPYFINILGFKLYGEVIFYQTIVGYISLIVNFGFNISGVKSIINAHSVIERNQIISGIYLFKLFIFLLCVLIGVVLIGVIDSIHPILLMTSLTLVFNELLFPQWYFQAIEKLKFVAILSTIVKILSLVLMFIIINEESDYIYVPLLNGVGFFIIGLVSLCLMYKDGIRFKLPSIKLIWTLIKDSSVFFFSSAIISIKNKTDILIIGAFINKELVVAYDMALKLINVSQLPISIINNAFFAKMSKERSKRSLLGLVYSSFVVSLIISLSVYLLSPFVIKYMTNGDNFTEIIMLLHFMLIGLPLFSIGVTLSQSGIIAFGFSKQYLLGMISTTIFYLIGLGIIFISGYSDQVQSYAILSVLVYLYEASYRYLLCKFLRIL